jgi:DNA-binding response OmpR family regulator
MLNIVIVEDNDPLREALVDVLAAEEHHVAAFDSAESFLAEGSLDMVDIVLLDLNLPGEDGVSLARRLRADRPDVGIIMLTARGAPEQRRVGYESGADIYLTKPSSAPELTSSIQALARRLQIDQRPQPVDQPEALVLNPQFVSLTGPGGMVVLTASETALLAAFAAAPDRRLSNEAILRLAPVDGPVSKSTLGVKIVRLRKKLLAAGAVGQPVTVIRNWGYQLSCPLKLA